MRSGFSSYACVTDACLSGYGVGGGYIGTSGIRNIFDCDERWRFKEHAEDGEPHRERALRQKHDNAKSVAVVAASNPLSDPIAASAVIGTTARSLLVDPAFPNIHSASSVLLCGSLCTLFLLRLQNPFIRVTRVRC